MKNKTNSKEETSLNMDINQSKESEIVKNKNGKDIATNKDIKENNTENIQDHSKKQTQKEIKKSMDKKTISNQKRMEALQKREDERKSQTKIVVDALATRIEFSSSDSEDENKGVGKIVIVDKMEVDFSGEKIARKAKKFK